MIRVGINGFGRIGRAFFRNNLDKNLFEVVAINDINPDIHNIAYTLNYDTLYDRLTKIFKVQDDYIISDSKCKIKITHHASIDEVDWKSMDVNVVVEATGVYKNVINAQNVINKKQAKKVIITHAPDKVDFTMVLGANEDQLSIDKHHVISSSICDATAIAPTLKLINQHFGIDHGYVTTLHPWLSYQNLIDGPASSWSNPGQIYHHFALGRSSIGNMIPKPTTAITATCSVLKKENITEQMIGSFSYRTPTAIVGSADITLSLKKGIAAKDAVAIFEEAEKNQQWHIIHNNCEPLVSLDFKKCDYSAVIDHRWTDVIKNRMLKLVLWYDNEWGYAARVLDQVKFVSDKLRGI